MIDLPLATSPEDALSQPTRRRLFALLAELKRPVGTVELAERLDLHPNGVRVHLDRLESAGLVTRDRARQARGRPRDAWTIASDARPGGDSPRAYSDLGRWLARAMRSGKRGLTSGRGHRTRDRTRARPGRGGHGDEALETTLVALGFQPRIQARTDDRLAICLRNCPYRDVVRENQPVVCTLHRGITRGLLDVLHPAAELAEFVPRDPDEAGCLIELRGIRDVVAS